MDFGRAIFLPFLSGIGNIVESIFFVNASDIYAPVVTDRILIFEIAVQAAFRCEADFLFKNVEPCDDDFGSGIERKGVSVYKAGNGRLGFHG